MIVFLVSAQGPTNVWQWGGNTISSYTQSSIGLKNNRSLLFKTNGSLAFKIDSLRIARIFSTTATSTVNGSFWYEGGITSTGNGFMFFSNDPSKSSNIAAFTNGSNTLSILQDINNNVWLKTANSATNPALILSVDENQNYEIDKTQQAFFINSTSSPVGFSSYLFSSGAVTGQTASTERNSFQFNGSSTQYSVGALARHRNFRIAQRTISFTGASVLTDCANLYIENALIGGANSTINNSDGLRIGGMTGTVSVSSNVINSYGLSCFASAGATNVYAARFLGGNVGIATSTPQAGLDVATTMSVGSTFTVNGAMNASSTLSVANNFSVNGNQLFTGTTQCNGTVNIGPGTYGTDNLHQLRVSKGTGTVDIGEYTSGRGAIWLNQNTPSSSNWALSSDGSGNIFVNAPSGGVDITVGGSILNILGTNSSFTNRVRIGNLSTPTTSSPTLEVTGTMSVSSTFTGAAAILSTNQTAGIGYATGSGSTVTQGTNRTTGVTINAINGAITLVSAAGTTAWQSFVVSNTAVAATDVPIVVQKSGTDLNEIHVTNVTSNAFTISFRTTGGTTTEQPVFNFAIIKAVTN